MDAFPALRYRLDGDRKQGGGHTEMGKIESYGVETAPSLYALVEKVCQAIKVGFQPLGGVTPIPRTADDTLDEPHWAQAIVKYELP